MAKAIITLEDGDDGNVKCVLTFDPPVTDMDAPMTPAQEHAMSMLEHSTKVADVVDEPKITMRGARRKR